MTIKKFSQPTAIVVLQELIRIYDDKVRVIKGNPYDVSFGCIPFQKTNSFVTCDATRILEQCHLYHACNKTSGCGVSGDGSGARFTHNENRNRYLLNVFLYDSALLDLFCIPDDFEADAVPDYIINSHHPGAHRIAAHSTKHGNMLVVLFDRNLNTHEMITLTAIIGGNFVCVCVF